MAQPPDHPVTQIVRELESRLRREPVRGVLDRETVEALDVVGHALTFSRHPRALELWRDALWNRRLAAETSAAISEMLQYMVEAANNGRREEVSAICDCLHGVIQDARSRDAHERGGDDDAR